MEEYTVILQLSLKVAAPNASDALDIVLDGFGPGRGCGADVVEYEVLKIAESK